MLIDCDVHQELGNDTGLRDENGQLLDDDGALFSYLSEGWQEFVLGPAGGSMQANLTGGSPMPIEAPAKAFGWNPFGSFRKDAVPPGKWRAGCDPQFMATELLDRYDIAAAILTGGGCAMGVSGWSNPYFAREVSRALNDQTLDVWVAADERYLASIVPAMHVPEWAAQEIRRLGEHPRVAQALFINNPQTVAFGHPLFDPVHRACAETGLPFAIHTFGDCYPVVVSPTASGYPTLYGEYHGQAPQGHMSHLTSFIVHGVFDRYPDLKLVLIESGPLWLPSYCRRFEADFKGLRREFPWVKRLPHEYIHDNVRVTTQPFDVDSADDSLIHALDRFGGEDTVMFASDYPHWDTDVPTTTMSLLPEHWQAKVGHENAAALYGIKVPVAA